MNKGVVEKIRAAGGEVYAITSEPQHLADQAHEHWELNFENIGDPVPGEFAVQAATGN